MISLLDSVCGWVLLHTQLLLKCVAALAAVLSQRLSLLVPELMNQPQAMN